MKIVVLDARRFENKEVTHEYLKKVFVFPEYYGNNLDALADCLSEIQGLRTVIIHSGEAGEYYRKVLPVFEDCGEVVMV